MLISPPVRLDAIPSGELEDPCLEPRARHGTETKTVAHAIAEGLVTIGVRLAFGLYGRALAPVAAALQTSGIRMVHAQHESGAAFAALEASMVSERPVVVFTTTGPGLTNALTGLVGARREGGRVLALSACTSAQQRGRGAFQESYLGSLPAALYTPGPVFHDAAILESSAALQGVLRRFHTGFSLRGGHVAHLSVPVSVQLEPYPETVGFAPMYVSPPTCSAEVVRRCRDRLSQGRAVLWVGFGARHAAAEVREVAERLQCPVMATPRAKGIFPEDHPLYLGVTGLGGGGALAALQGDPADTILVLGTRLGEYSSFWAPGLLPRQGFIFVDLDPTPAGAAFPAAAGEGVLSDIGWFLRELLRDLPALPGGKLPPPPVGARPAVASEATEASGAGPAAAGETRAAQEGSRLHPATVMEAMQRVVVEGSTAVVLTEAGNAFAWGSHALRFQTPGRYRTSVGWGSMGHATSGVIGAALASRGKAVALVGDGAMLMQHELVTALTHRLPAVWIVLNDGQYGMVHHGMIAHGLPPVGTQFAPVDFAQMAQAIGVAARSASNEGALNAGLEEAMAADGPFLLDVWVDPDVPPPIMTRVSGALPGAARLRSGRRPGEGAP